MKRRSKFLAAAALGFMLGCIMMPATFDSRIVPDLRPIEEHAELLLDYIEGRTDALPSAETPEPTETSLLNGVIGLLIPVRIAYAAEFDGVSPAVTQAAEAMRARNRDILALKKGGSTGENFRGLLEMVHPEVFTDNEEKNAAQRLVAAENKNRKALYREIAQLNREQNLLVSVVERVHAGKRLERARPGDLFQLPPAGADFDAFKASPAGKRLGGTCQPEAWVTIQ